MDVPFKDKAGLPKAAPSSAGEANGHQVEYTLGEQIGFYLRQANQRHVAIFASLMAEKLTTTQWAALVKLKDLQPCSQGNLGRETAMDMATIKGVVDRLVKRGLAHVPENRLVFPGLTVRDNLVLGAWSRPRNAPLDDVLELFPRLVTRLGQTAGSLSGGEQQMLAIGRALMSRPTVLILDEPSIGLAPRIVIEIMDVLARLRDSEGLAILLVEQNLSAAFRVADRAVVVTHGRVALEGEPEQLMRAPEVRDVYFGGLDAAAG